MSTCRRQEGTVVKHPGSNSEFPRQLSQKTLSISMPPLASWLWDGSDDCLESTKTTLAAGPPQLSMRTRWAARVAQFWSWP